MPTLGDFRNPSGWLFETNLKESLARFAAVVFGSSGRTMIEKRYARIINIGSLSVPSFVGSMKLPRRRQQSGRCFPHEPLGDRMGQVGSLC